MVVTVSYIPVNTEGYLKKCYPGTGVDIEIDVKTKRYRYIEIHM